MLESAYQSRLIRKIEKRFPGCLVLKNDSGYRQGIPDLVVLYRDRWALLEVKANADADHQPNQEHYIDWASGQSFASFIYPENEREVLDAMERSFEASWASRVP